MAGRKHWKHSLVFLLFLDFYMKRAADNYISLQEATRHCNYSQEYLSLRARQGKLGAVKFGRNWVTKIEWLDEYVKKTQEFEETISQKKSVILPDSNNIAQIQETKADEEIKRLEDFVKKEEQIPAAVLAKDDFQITHGAANSDGKDSKSYASANYRGLIFDLATICFFLLIALMSVRILLHDDIAIKFSSVQNIVTTSGESVDIILNGITGVFADELKNIDDYVYAYGEVSDLVGRRLINRVSSFIFADGYANTVGESGDAILKSIGDIVAAPFKISVKNMNNEGQFSDIAAAIGLLISDVSEFWSGSISGILSYTSIMESSGDIIIARAVNCLDIGFESYSKAIYNAKIEVDNFLIDSSQKDSYAKKVGRKLVAGINDIFGNGE